MSRPLRFPATRAQLQAMATEPGPRQAAAKLWKGNQPVNATGTLQYLYRKAGVAYPWGVRNVRAPGPAPQLPTPNSTGEAPLRPNHQPNSPVLRSRLTPGLLPKLSNFPKDHEALNAIRPLAAKLAKIYRKIYCPGCTTVSCDLCQVALEVAPFGKPLRLSRPVKS